MVEHGSERVTEAGERTHGVSLFKDGVSIYADKELGRQLARLRFDSLQEVLCGFSDELERQSMEDGRRGRTKLSAVLREARNAAEALLREIGKAFDISRPHLEKEEHKAITPGCNAD
jgi:hypothetical protein